MADDMAEHADAGDGADAMPEVRIRYGGTYAADGTWDLSGPFGDEDGIGGTVADLVIREAVTRAGVPSALEDDAIDALSDVARGPIADFVNGRLPVGLRPGGAVLAQITQVLASADVASTWSINEAGGSVTGNETVTSIGFVHDSEVLVLTPADLVPGSSPEIRASVSGDRTSSGFIRDDATYQIYLGTLVEKVATELLGVDVDLSSQAVVDAIDCPQVVSSVTGGGAEVELSVAGQTVSIGAGDLQGGCADIALAAADRVIGLFSADTPVTLGGSVSVTDSDGDEVADRLTAGANYGGTVAVVDPLLDPRISASFQAARQ